MRQSEPFTYFSESNLPLLPGLDSKTERLFKLKRDFSVIKHLYEKIPRENRPLVAIMVPLIKECDSWRFLLDDASYVRSMFAMHVRSFPEHSRYFHCEKPVEENGEWIDDATIKRLSFEWMFEAVTLIIQRSDGKGGDLPLPATSPGMSQGTFAQRSRLDIRAALTAKTETASDKNVNSSSKTNQEKTELEITSDG
jgi:hypothetical protein